jgi:hypothetical protein
MGSIVCDAEAFCVALGAIPGPDRSASLPKGTDTTIPAAATRHRELPPLAPHRFAVWCDRSGNTPPAAPARDFSVAGLLAHGSSPPTTFPRTRAILSGSFGRRLAAYSCGGSRGIVQAPAPRSLLIPCGNHRDHPARPGGSVTSVANATAGLSVLWSIGHSRVRSHATGCAAMIARRAHLYASLAETGARNIRPAGLRAPRRARSVAPWPCSTARHRARAPTG